MLCFVFVIVIEISQNLLVFKISFRFILVSKCKHHYNDCSFIPFKATQGGGLYEGGGGGAYKQKGVSVTRLMGL